MGPVSLGAGEQQHKGTAVGLGSADQGMGSKAGHEEEKKAQTLSGIQGETFGFYSQV